MFFVDFSCLVLSFSNFKVTLTVFFIVNFSLVLSIILHFIMEFCLLIKAISWFVQNNLKFDATDYKKILLHWITNVISHNVIWSLFSLPMTLLDRSFGSVNGHGWIFWCHWLSEDYVTLRITNFMHLNLNAILTFRQFGWKFYEIFKCWNI